MTRMQRTLAAIERALASLQHTVRVIMNPFYTNTSAAVDGTTGDAADVNDQFAALQAAFDAVYAAITTLGYGPWSQNVDANGKLLKNLGLAVDNGDAVSKAFLTAYSGALAGLPSAVGQDGKYLKAVGGAPGWAQIGLAAGAIGWQNGYVDNSGSFATLSDNGIATIYLNAKMDVASALAKVVAVLPVGYRPLAAIPFAPALFFDASDGYSQRVGLVEVLPNGEVTLDALTGRLTGDAQSAVVFAADKTTVGLPTPGNGNSLVRDAAGNITLVCSVKDTGAGGIDIGTLPAAFRPSTDIFGVIGYSSNGLGGVDVANFRISPAGDIQIFHPGVTGGILAIANNYFNFTVTFKATPPTIPLFGDGRVQPEQNDLVIAAISFPTR